MTKVAIMQPTYLPWSGYFGLMSTVDIFVILDDVQFARRSWQQRNQIKTIQGPKWLTLPIISKGLREQKINQTQIDCTSNFHQSHRKAIEHNYSKSTYFTSTYPELMPLINNNQQILTELTIPLINFIKQYLEISTKIVFSSQLSCSGKKADLLANICKEVDANLYISPPGSRDYLENSTAFTNSLIPINYYSFEHPLYKQLHGEFTPYMSVIDMIFNIGKDSIFLIKDASNLKS